MCVAHPNKFADLLAYPANTVWNVFSGSQQGIDEFASNLIQFVNAWATLRKNKHSFRGKSQHEGKADGRKDMRFDDLLHILILGSFLSRDLTTQS